MTTSVYRILKLESMISTSTRSVLSTINDKFDKSSLSYHKSNLLLLERETTGLLVNRQLIPITIQPKSISLEQICYKDVK